MMPFSENVRFMKKLYSQMPTKEFHSNTLTLYEHLSGLELRYPGNLTGKKIGDYCLYLDGHRPSHSEIVRAIHDHCHRHGGDTPTDVIMFLEDLATNGLQGKTDLRDSFHLLGRKLDGRQTRIFLYWLILQEDINYPNQMGVRMPLTRYVEAVISSTNPEMLSLRDVITRTNVRGRPSPRFSHPHLSIRYDHTFKIIDSMRRT